MKRHNRKLILLILSLVMVFTLAACGGNNAGNQQNPASQPAGNSTTDSAATAKTIKLSHNMPVDSSVDKAAKLFQERVEESTNGQIKVEIFGQSQLGSMREQTESVQFGSTDMTIQPIATLTPFVEDLQLVDFPFLWPNEDVLWKVLDSQTGQAILDTMEDAGFKGLGFWAGGFKAMTGNKKIASPDDLKGFKMRVIPSPLLIAQYEAWGANPVPVDFAELYNSLQQGVVDGQENPLETISVQKYNEVQKNLMIANHGYLAYITTLNLDFFESLTPEEQQIIIDAEKEAREYERQLALETEAEYIAGLEAAGMEVYRLTDEEKAVFRELSLPVHEEFSKTDRQKDLLQAVYKAIEEAQ